MSERVYTRGGPISELDAHGVPALITEPLWHSTDGTWWPLSHIENDHLLNIERFLMGKGTRPLDKKWLTAPLLRKRWLRYVQSEMVARKLTSKVIEFDDSDVLAAEGTLVLPSDTGPAF